MRGRSDLKCAFEKSDENSRTFVASRLSSFQDDESGMPVSEGARDARTAVARLGAAVKACKKAEQLRLLFSDLSSKMKRQRKQTRTTWQHRSALPSPGLSRTFQPPWPPKRHLATREKRDGGTAPYALYFEEVWQGQGGFTLSLEATATRERSDDDNCSSEAAHRERRRPEDHFGLCTESKNAAAIQPAESEQTEWHSPPLQNTRGGDGGSQQTRRGRV